MYKVSILNSNDILDNYYNEWNSLKSIDDKARLFSSTEWIEIVQDTEDCKIYILCAFDNDQLIAGIPLNKITKDECDHYSIASHFQSGIPITPLENFDFITDPVFENSRENISLFNRAGTSFDFRFEEKLIPEVLKNVFSQMMEYLENKIANGLPIAILYSCNLPAFMEDILKEKTYGKILIGARYSLHASNLNEYIHKFSGKKKASIKNEIKKFEKFGLKCNVKDHDEYIETFTPMVKENFVKHGFKTFSSEFYKNRADFMSKILGKKYFYLEVTHDEKPIAGACCILENLVLHIYHVGFLYNEIVKDWSTYFHLVFYQPLILSDTIPLLKFKEIYTYEGADQLKLSRGSTPDYIFHYFKINELNDKQRLYIEELNSSIEIYHNRTSGYKIGGCKL